MPNETGLFNALSGPEVVKFLQDKIGKALENTGEFKEHITFPWWKYEFSVKVLSYPKQDIDEEYKTVAVGSGEEGKGDDEAPVAQLDVVGSDVIDTPDKARVESNQPILAPQVGPGNVVIDKPHKAPEKVLAPAKRHKGK